MAQQVIGVGQFPNDSTGDPLRDAFIKINDNFTELYTDESQGEVNSVTGSGGINASPTTGAVVVSLNDDSITYDKLGVEFTDLVSQNDLSFGTETIHVGTISGDATLNILGVKQGVTKTAIFTGGTSLGFGGTVTSTYNVIAGEYDPAADNFIQIFASGVYPNQDFYITISQPTV